jgi:probable HAF family extracellular repeat protein/YD repeat-containing protein
MGGKKMGEKQNIILVGTIVATIIFLMLSMEANAAITVVDLQGDIIGDSSDAVALNDAGQAIGKMETPYGTHAFIWQNGTMTDLGTLAGESGSFSTANAINDSGIVAGRSKDSTGKQHAAIWINRIIKSLALESESYSNASSINNRNQVAGESTISDKTLAFIWDNGVYTILPSIYDNCLTKAINSQGQVVGYCTSYPSGEDHIVIWPGNNEVIELGLGNVGNPVDINDAGTVTGTIITSPEIAKAFIWKNGQIAYLPTLGGAGSVAWAINNRDQVIGFSNTANGENHAFYWEIGAMTDIGTFGGNYSSATAINEKGDITGSAGDISNKGRPYIWKNGAKTDLGTLGGDSATTRAINNHGWIVGQSYNSNGQLVATLWITERTPAEQLADLIALVKSFNLKQGIANSLDSKLQNVQKALTAANQGDMATACNLLGAFINETQAQSDKEITADQATQLVNAAISIQTALGCLYINK